MTGSGTGTDFLQNCPFPVKRLPVLSRIESIRTEQENTDGRVKTEKTRGRHRQVKKAKQEDQRSGDRKTEIREQK